MTWVKSIRKDFPRMRNKLSEFTVTGLLLRLMAMLNFGLLLFSMLMESCPIGHPPASSQNRTSVPFQRFPYHIPSEEFSNPDTPVSDSRSGVENTPSVIPVV